MVKIQFYDIMRLRVSYDVYHTALTQIKQKGGAYHGRFRKIR